MTRALLLALAVAGNTSSTSRVVSPAVVASWMSHDQGDASTTTLLVLWRGTPGWYSKGGRGAASSWSSGGGGQGGASFVYLYMNQGGLNFAMEFDYDKRTAKILGEVISLRDVNVVLVDFVDSGRPAIVATRWIEPGPPAPPAVPGAAPDPIAGVIRQSRELFDYLRCDLSVPDAPASRLIAAACARMQPEPR